MKNITKKNKFFVVLFVKSSFDELSEAGTSLKQEQSTLTFVTKIQ